MIGAKIVDVRLMKKKDLEFEGWEHTDELSAVLVLDNGDKIYASQDYEGNGPGALFGVRSPEKINKEDGARGFVVYPSEEK